MANAQHSRSSGHGATQDEVNLEIDDSQSLRQLEEGHQPPILVLSRDTNLVETVKKAAPRGVPVAFAPDLDHVAEKLSNLKPGVLVADTASTADVASMVAQLTQHFPELVVVVAGKREDSASLMQLTAAGRIFRFLLTPLSHGQTRLALEAAVKQHLDLSAAGERLSTGSAGGEGGSKNYVMTYGALAAGLLVVIGGIWFGVSRFTGGDSELPVMVNPAPAPGVPQPGGVPERPDPVKAELALAKDAFDQGKFIEPQGESALDLYRSALALDPNSQGAKDGIRSVVDKILERAEAALLAERLEEAIRTIETARDIDSTHPRLAFLDTQVGRERERLKLTQAQEVGNRVRSLINNANDRMVNGRLLTPNNASAKDALLEARRLDPTDPVVVSTIREFSAQLTEEARKSLAAGKIDEATAFVNGARQMGSAGSALAAVERSLAEANRNSPAGAGPASSQSAGTPRRPGTPGTPGASPAGAGPNIDAMVSDVRQRLTEGKLIDPAGDSARDLLATLRAAAPNRPEADELARTLSTRLLDSGRQAMNAKAFERSSQLIAAAKDVGQRFNGPAIAQAESDLTSARSASDTMTSIVSAASLKRVRMVSPVYPDTARKRGIEGWVELAFTVQTNGTVDQVEVRNASPAEVFDDAATRAVRQWRFEPVERNGERVEQRAMVRLRFSQQAAQ
jgi:TonB family protein